MAGHLQLLDIVRRFDLLPLALRFLLYRIPRPRRLLFSASAFAYLLGVNGMFSLTSRCALLLVLMAARDGQFVSGNWVQLWRDDFQTFDTTKWEAQEGNGSQYGIPGWANNEYVSLRIDRAVPSNSSIMAPTHCAFGSCCMQQTYTRNNVGVKNGKLVIEGRYESTGQLTSGKVRTQGKYHIVPSAEYHRHKNRGLHEAATG